MKIVNDVSYRKEDLWLKGAGHTAEELVLLPEANGGNSLVEGEVDRCTPGDGKDHLVEMMLYPRRYCHLSRLDWRYKEREYFWKQRTLRLQTCLRT